ncbi:PX domain-containing protein EREX isoform X2 [Diospyros lotus]|uniref:PX domain-containing protein EREX isoform X2 n=1 Tax=Diospyros lotus TaxID=55363 RepID=UPI00225C2D03|nr:PX domain-containing protein EREX isoform X2 [Diospyros lotus]
MNLYGLDPGMYDFGFADPTIVGSLYRPFPYLAPRGAAAAAAADGDDGRPPVLPKKATAPPRHRHDGTSPLPFGMDWSPPPQHWFYRVQIGIQSPEGITTTRGLLRRFSEFLKLFSELRVAFPKKKLPPAPPKKLLKNKSRALLEERRHSLEDWMGQLLSDIDLSRSAPVAIFLELEAAARSSFYESNQEALDANSAGLVWPYQLQSNSDVSLCAHTSSITSDYDNESAYKTSELGKTIHGRDIHPELNEGNRTSDQGQFSWHTKDSNNENSALDSKEATYGTSKSSFPREDEIEPSSKPENCKLGSHHQQLSTESVGSDVNSVRGSENSYLGVANFVGDNSLDLPEGLEIPGAMDILMDSDLQSARDLSIALPSDEHNKLNRVLNTLQRRLATAKTDMEDLVARLNQELTVRQYLTTKVKYLEVDLETTNQSSKENLQQAVLIERERFTQTQWDVEEMQRKCIEMELKLKCEQDEKLQLESTKVSIVQENEMLQKELDSAREQIKTLQKHHEDLELKSKADVKLLVKEVKSLRSSQSELKQELSRLMKEKAKIESVLQKEKEKWEHSNAANEKLLHECEILRSRLEECSVNFLIEEENKLIVDASSPSDAMDLLSTSDNRIGFLLAEAQLLAQDLENTAAAATHNGNDGNMGKMDELRKMLTDIFIDNARLRKQVNSVIRQALSMPEGPETDDEEKEVALRETVLSKFFEK